MSEAGNIPSVAATATPPAGCDTIHIDPMHHAPQELEAMFLAEVLDPVTPRPDGHDLLGDADGALDAMLNEEVASLISRSIGIGLADAVLRTMPKARELA